MPNTHAIGPSLGRTSKARHRFALVLVLGVAAPGCAFVFGIDLPPLRGSEGGEGGEFASAGSGGSPAMSGRNGSGGEASVAGRGEAGMETPGGGADARGAGAAGSGDGGEGGEHELEPKAGDPCTRPGALACPRPLSQQRLFCENGVWVAEDCGTNYLCDRRTGACGLRHYACYDANSGDHVCQLINSGYQSVICGADLVSVVVLEQCVFGCHTEDIDERSGRCLEPTGSQVVVEKEPAVLNSQGFWPGASIPVCIAELSDATNPDDQAWIGMIRDEVDSTWGRYAGIRFAGWEACTEGATGVKLSLLEDTEVCRDELGGIDRIGYPGSTETVEVKFCSRYYDARNVTRAPDQGLMRLIARHEFGHVLGFDDVSKIFSEKEFMARGVDAELFYPFTIKHAGLLQKTYGRKPSGALVDRRGRCLGPNGTFVAECDGSAAQIFRPENGQLRHAGSGLCLAVNAEDASIDLSPCAASAEADSAQAFRPSATQVRGLGGVCLAADEDEIVVEDCPAFGTARTLWNVEFVDADTRIRIRQAGTESCVGVREDEQIAGYYRGKLEPCDCSAAAPDCIVPNRFEFTSTGQIALGGHCFTAPLENYGAMLPRPGELALEPCSLAPEKAWNLSGRFENGDGSLALTLADDAETPGLVARPIEAAQLESQIFDSYFSEVK